MGGHGLWQRRHLVYFPTDNALECLVPLVRWAPPPRGLGLFATDTSASSSFRRGSEPHTHTHTPQPSRVRPPLSPSHNPYQLRSWPLSSLFNTAK